MPLDSAARTPQLGCVRRRHVFYLSGFDPRGPRHYHRLYASQAPQQAAVSGYDIQVGARQSAGPNVARWTVEADFGAQGRATTVFEFLRWDDVVRAHWHRSRWRVMLGSVYATALQIANGVLWRVFKVSRPACVALMAPCALVALLSFGVTAIVLMSAMLARGGAVLSATVMSLLGVGGCFILGRWAEQKLQMSWVTRSMKFISRQACGQTPSLERRLDEFALHVDKVLAQTGDSDEVLVVGHSSGAILAISVVARVLAKRVADARASGQTEHSAGAPARLALLTLGHCIPLLSYQPQAVAFRAELALLAQTPELVWLDFTAPADGCCFALTDPTAVCAERQSSHPWATPKILSPRFVQLFSAAAYSRLRRNQYRCHFQYLMATEYPGVYDYFALTAGTQTLAVRFESYPSLRGASALSRDSK